MRNQLARYFRLNVGERRGALGLLLTSMVALVLSAWMKRQTPQEIADISSLEEKAAMFAAQSSIIDSENNAVQVVLSGFDPNIASTTELEEKGIPSWLAQRIDKFRNKGGKFKTAQDLAKIYGMPPDLFARLEPYILVGSGEANKASTTKAPAERFPFDPNTASEAEFMRLGVPERTAKSIANYRSKGGKFRTPMDFKKIYGLDESLYLALESYIQIKVAEEIAPVMHASTKSKPEIPATSFDINTSSVADWQNLPGIGPVFAEKIVKYRDILGGFARVEAVAETRYLPDSVFQKVRPFLKSSTVYRKLKINEIDEKSLDLHPYFDRTQAKLIIAYRNQHGAYKRVEEVGAALPMATADWLAKVGPYVSF
jgi:DNA uptake protein ComE-like DNA-binding protein